MFLDRTRTLVSQDWTWADLGRLWPTLGRGLGLATASPWQRRCVCATKFASSLAIIPQTVLALRGSDGFSRDLWRVPGVTARSLGASSYCKYAVKVTPTFATLQRNRGSRAQIHKNSMVFVNFCLEQTSVLSQQQTSCLSQRQTSAASEAAWRSWRGLRQKLTKTIEFSCI